MLADLLVKLWISNVLYQCAFLLFLVSSFVSLCYRFATYIDSEGIDRQPEPCINAACRFEKYPMFLELRHLVVSIQIPR